MKKSVYTLMILIYLIFYSTNLISQCTNGTNYYPSTIYEPVDGVWGSATSCNWAGEVIRVNVKNGDSYEISTCDTYGGTIAGYDTQLTLFDESGNFVGFNGIIEWDTSTPAGQYRKPSSNQGLLDLGWKNGYTDFDIALKRTCDWAVKQYPNLRGVE